MLGWLQEYGMYLGNFLHFQKTISFEVGNGAPRFDKNRQ